MELPATDTSSERHGRYRNSGVWPSFRPRVLCTQDGSRTVQLWYDSDGINSIVRGSVHFHDHDSSHRHSQPNDTACSGGLWAMIYFKH